MTILEAMQQTAGADIRNRVKFFIIKAGVAIVNEPPSTDLHSERLALAREVLRDSNKHLSTFVEQLPQNPTILAKISLDGAIDSEIEFVVNSVWDAMTSVLGLA